jgi:hypothetical protein
VTIKTKPGHGDDMNVQTYTALARLSRLLAALLTLPVFLGVAMLYVIVILGTWIVDGDDL